MYKHDRLDFSETNLKPSLLEAYSDVNDSLNEHSALFERYRKRLEVVRQEKAKRQQEILGGYTVLYMYVITLAAHISRIFQVYIRQ